MFVQLQNFTTENKGATNMAYMKCKGGVECQWHGTEVTQTVDASQHAQRQHAKYRRQY